MTYAIINDGIVVNVIELHSENAEDFEGAVPLYDIPAIIGDTYENGKFYRDGKEVLSASDAAQKEMEEYAASAQADTDAMLVDHEYRLTLLELGITEEV